MDSHNSGFAAMMNTVNYDRINIYVGKKATALFGRILSRCHCLIAIYAINIRSPGTVLSTI
jgi:hypothetical protein